MLTGPVTFEGLFILAWLWFCFKTYRETWKKPTKQQIFLFSGFCYLTMQLGIINGLLLSGLILLVIGILKAIIRDVTPKIKRMFDNETFNSIMFFMLLIVLGLFASIQCVN